LLLGKRVGDQSRIAERSSRTPGRRIEKAASVSSASSRNPRHLERLAIIQHARDRSPDRRDPYKLPADSCSNGELRTDRRAVVPVMLGYERLRLLYRHRHNAQAL
jgi:hypothetical protein